jgi:hypothetical protein
MRSRVRVALSQLLPVYMDPSSQGWMEAFTILTSFTTRSHFFASPCCSPLPSQDLARFHAYQSGLCGVIAIISLYILRHWFGWYTLSIICGMGALGASWVAGYVARVNRNGDRSEEESSHASSHLLGTPAADRMLTELHQHWRRHRTYPV